MINTISNTNVVHNNKCSDSDLIANNKNATAILLDDKIPRVKREIIITLAQKWLRAIREDDVKSILPDSKEKLNVFEIWWYDMALINNFLNTHPKTDINDKTVILGYYNEPFYIGTFLQTQYKRMTDNSLNEYQLQALKDIELTKNDKIMDYVITATAKKWLQAMENNKIKDILPSSKSMLKFYDLWWYKFNLANLYRKKKGYLDLNGNTCINGYYGEKFHLNSWLNTQQKQAIDGLLTNDQLLALKDLGLKLPSPSVHQKKIKSDLVATEWLDAIKRNALKDILPQKRECLSVFEVWWYNFAVAKKYFDINHNLDLSKRQLVIGYYGEDVNIGEWIVAQRNRKRSGTLSEKQIKALEDINMIWKKNYTLDEQWLMNYKETIKYKEAHGDLLIPTDYIVVTDDNVMLNVGIWLKNQRAKYEEGTLIEKRKELLNRIGMVWQVRDAQWNEKFNAAKKYYERYGDLLVSPCYTSQNRDDVQSLYDWLVKQRKLYLEKKLSDDKIKLLESIKISWLDIDLAWLKMYDYATKYYDKNHNLQIVNSYSFNDSNGNHVNLGNWIKLQQLNYQNGKLSDLQIAMLNKIGMIWNKNENRYLNIKLFAKYDLSQYASVELVNKYSCLEINAKINFCLENEEEHPIIVNGKLNPIFTMSSEDIKEKCHGVSLEDMVIMYRERLNLVR